jgi:Ca2+-dependent lipid-binding protein
MSKQPNELFVVLIRARNLTPQNRKHNQSRQADPFVLLSCAGKETRSTTKKATLNPRWTERYTWDADDSTDVLDIEIRDACAYTGADFLGRVGVEMDQLRKRQALRKFLVLKNADDYRDEDRGEIELLLHWRHNPHFTPKKFPEESPRRSVFIEPYAIFMNRLHQTRS